MELDKWAVRHGIPQAAINDLRGVLGAGIAVYPSATLERSEAAILNITRLEATKKGARLWRNNVGALYSKDGAFIRYGLANDSSALNGRIKSADLIGIRPIRITQEHVGMIIGQFLSREIKSSRWTYSGTEREQAQLAWAELIIALGGDACFTTAEGTI